LFEESENPKSEYRNPKQIRNSKVQKGQTKKRIIEFGAFGFVSNFGFRASGLDALIVVKFFAILRTILFLRN